MYNIAINKEAYGIKSKIRIKLRGIRMNDYIAGVNLGGWISQYGRKDKNHFDTFITQRDIDRIASWGMDHVRLPIDYDILVDDDEPSKYKISGFYYIDNCIEWCKKNGLNVILDLHKAPGYSFGTVNQNTLFSDEIMQQRFIDIWKVFAKRYINEDDNIRFELLNEVVEPNSLRWNRLIKRTVDSIRKIDQSRKIIVGGNFYNSVFTLKELDILDDDNIIYNFHYYEPILFTHQGAAWNEVNMAYGQKVHYPGEFPDLDSFLNENPKFKDGLGKLVGVKNDRALMSLNLKHAADFIEKSEKPLYCGEFGVIEKADEASKVNWLNDLIDILLKYHIGRACWSYKEMNFGLVDIDGEIISIDAVKAVSRK